MIMIIIIREFREILILKLTVQTAWNQSVLMINCWGNSVSAETSGWDVQESKANLQADDLKTGFSYDPVWWDLNNEVSRATCKCLNMIKTRTQMSKTILWMADTTCAILAALFSSESGWCVPHLSASLDHVS